MKKLCFALSIFCLSAVTLASTAFANSPSSLDKIKSRGELIIATSGNFAPVTYVGKDGNLTGIDIDLGKKLAEGLGVKVKFVAGTFSGLVPGLMSGKFDIVMSGLTATPSRKKSIAFSAPYGSSAYGAVALKSNNKPKGLEDLHGLRVGCISGTPQMEWVMKKGGYESMKEYPGNAEAFTDLKAGRIDIYVVSTLVAGDYIQKDHSARPLKIVGKPINQIGMAVGMRKGEPELKAAIDAIIHKLGANGYLDNLGKKYVGRVLPRPEEN